LFSEPVRVTMSLVVPQMLVAGQMKYSAPPSATFTTSAS
jgi:hypothetical protein